MGEPTVLNYIRKNISLSRVKEVEKTLSEWWPPINLLDLDKYFNWALMETVYRSHKGSYKIEDSKIRGTAYLALILHLLFGEPKFNPVHVISVEYKKKIVNVLRKHFEKDSYFLTYSLKYLAIKTGERDKRTGWINIEPYVYPILGGEIFYYCTLMALIEISKKALKDKNYQFPQIINWKEGIIDYLVSEVIGKHIIEESSSEHTKKRGD